MSTSDFVRVTVMFVLGRVELKGEAGGRNIRKDTEPKEGWHRREREDIRIIRHHQRAACLPVGPRVEGTLVVEELLDHGIAGEEGFGGNPTALHRAEFDPDFRPKRCLRSQC